MAGRARRRTPRRARWSVSSTSATPARCRSRRMKAWSPATDPRPRRRSGRGAVTDDGEAVAYREFDSRREGMIHAMDGGLWLHRHVWKGRRMAHLVSTDRARLLAYGRRAGLRPEHLQFKPLKD